LHRPATAAFACGVAAQCYRDEQQICQWQAALSDISWKSVNTLPARRAPAGVIVAMPKQQPVRLLS
jgi:hypothetical protein